MTVESPQELNKVYQKSGIRRWKLLGETCFEGRHIAYYLALLCMLVTGKYGVGSAEIRERVNQGL
jgi:hypothetical protein